VGIFVTRNYLNADVTLSLAAPPGITGVFTPAVLNQQTQHSTLVISVAANVAPGSYHLTVTGSALGISGTAAITFGVPAQSAFTLTPLPPSLILPLGDFYFQQIQINRANFTGPVSVFIESAPAGLQISNMPVLNVTGSLIEFLVQAPPSMPVGTYTITLRGTSPGQATQTTSFELTVTDAKYLLSFSPGATIRTYPGAIVSVTIGAIRTNWPHDIALTLEPAFESVAGTLSNATLSPATPTSTLTIQVPDTALGTRTIGVRSRSLYRELLYYVNVGIQWLGLAVFQIESNVLSIPRGSSGSTRINVSNTYNGTLGMVVSGSPSGMTVAVNPNPVVPNGWQTGTITVDVAPTVAPGQYSLTLTTNTPGIHATPLSFTVVVPP